MDPSSRSGRREAKQKEPPDKNGAESSEASDEKPSKEHRLGHPDSVLRVLSFGGGGFDTTMQLGVVHALLVIQGRAPDAVVGLSAGAINSVLLAEVLQAGDELEERSSGSDRAEKHRLRMRARVARFRELLDRLFRAPQELVDGLLPDAYQVDARKPLQTVQAPIFVERERKRRDEAVANRAGLVRLYNHLLGLGVSFGTITRAVRRVLGYRAAGEIRSRGPRITVRVMEIVRMWILAGANLLPISRVLFRMAMGLAGSWGRERGTTAGAIIFKFRLLELAIGFLMGIAALLLTAAVWLIFTFGVLLFPWALAELSPLTTVQVTTVQAYLLTGGGLVGLGLGVWASVTPMSRSSFWKVATDVVKSVVVLAGLIVVWLLPFFIVGVIWLGSPADLTPEGIRNLPMAVPPWVRPWAVVVIVLVACTIVGGILYLSRRAARPGIRHPMLVRLMRRVLDGYRIRRSLFSSYPLERLFSDLFDPEYWGEVPLDEAVDLSLADHDRPWKPDPERPPKRRRLARYSNKREGAIHVGITAADLEEGRLTVISEDASVVSALVAANAVVPFFPPKRLCTKHYVDGANIANEPMQGVMDLLRERGVDAEIEAVHVYSVTPFPVSSKSLPPSPADPPASESGQERLSLVEAARRARRLQRFRDATLERRLTELFSMTMPKGRGTLKVSVQPPPGSRGNGRARPEEGSGPDEGDERSILRAWVIPVEPDAPLDLNTRLFRAPRADRRRLVYETIADGCRAALEVMVRPSLDEPPGAMRCGSAVVKHLQARRKAAPEGEEIAKVIGDPLPGCDPADDGPGLSEICRHCALNRNRERLKRERTLSFRTPWKETGPAWPHEFEEKDAPGDVRYEPPVPEYLEDATEALRELKEGMNDGTVPSWPVPDDEAVPTGKGETLERPVRSLLFSGGVFRGVYQMGVLAALSELGLKPDLIAGASVGSITAAMTASVVSEKDKGKRRAHLGRLAAAYLALDRIVLTDRFADFIRNLTVRAADARFSLRQGDRVFRRFDSTGIRAFDQDARLVFAGLERLFYMSPFEILKLVEAIRHRETSEVAALLRKYAQEWLDRMDAGDEVLGAEPLRRLIEKYVLRCVEEQDWSQPDGPSLDDLRDKLGIHFLATTTNLTEGHLQVLGMEARRGRDAGSPSLVEGLLASSAFPGVFRPRDSHEVFPGTPERCQYIDGGVIDNLPLDAVAEFLVAASPEGETPLIHRRPGTPHLVFSASLQVSVPDVRGVDLADLSWPELLRRTRRLGYNRKLEKYERTQRVLRAIDARFQKLKEDGEAVERHMEPLDLEVVVVKPNWLCGTFAFHPMTGFRRDRQERSIAHGCASTLVEFGRRNEKGSPPRWGAASDKVADVATLREAFLQGLHRRKRRDGQCWLMPDPESEDPSDGNGAPDRLCPFSKEALQHSDLGDETKDALQQIYEVCPHRKTHGLRRRA